MIKNKYLAKSYPIEETIQEHTDKLLILMTQLKNAYNKLININWDLLNLACMHHDLGKINPQFQNKLYKDINKKMNFKKYSLLQIDNEIKEIPHGCISTSLINKKYLENLTIEEKKILMWSVFYHHYRKGLNDILLEQKNIILEKEVEKYLSNFHYEKLMYNLEINYNIRRYIDQKPSIEENKELYYQYVMIKGLLNKIDYAASAQVNEIETVNTNLVEKLHGFMSKNNYVINDLQKYMYENCESNLIVVAPTGMGKTEAGLLWIGNNKGFFTLPLKVSINAIYKRVFNNIQQFKDVGLLHSDTLSEYINNNNDDEFDFDYYLRTQQLSLPLTISTLDQIIDVVYKYPNYEFKLATFSYSKIVIDEIQMYSADMIALLIVFLKQLTDINGKFLIMTATMPEIFIYLLKKYKIPIEEPKLFINKQIRHKMKIFQTEFDVNAVLNSFVSKKKKILIIVNTVKKAQKIYRTLKSAEELKNTTIKLFHARFIKEDKIIKSEQIFKFGQLDNKDFGIWVTTQVVEASMDIDFDELHTELSDLSGLIQRMGRVFRKRVLCNDETNIYVYVGNSYKDVTGVGVFIEKDIFEISKNNLLKFGNKEISEKDKLDLMDITYSYDSLYKTQYFKKINKIINTFMYITDFIYDKSDVDLRNIDTVNVIPKLIYDTNILKIEEKIINYKKCIWKEELIRKQMLMNDILNYSLQIPRKNLRNANFATIELSNFNKIYVIDYKYDINYGLLYENNEEDEEVDINKRFINR